MESVLVAAIWAGALFGAFALVVVYFGRSVKASLSALHASYSVRESAGEVDLDERRLTCGEREIALKLRRGTLEAEIGAAIAKLEAETAEHSTAAEAARRTIDDAVAAKQLAIAARGEAEARLAEESVRSDRDKKPDGANFIQVLQILVPAYENYCAGLEDDVPTWAEWIGGFKLQ